jgi:hypothetical protein
VAAPGSRPSAASETRPRASQLFADQPLEQAAVECSDNVDAGLLLDAQRLDDRLVFEAQHFGRLDAPGYRPSRASLSAWAEQRSDDVGSTRGVHRRSPFA